MKKKRTKRKPAKGPQTKATETDQFTTSICKILPDKFNPENNSQKDFNRFEWLRIDDELFSDPGL